MSCWTWYSMPYLRGWRRAQELLLSSGKNKNNETFPYRILVPQNYICAMQVYFQVNNVLNHARSLLFAWMVTTDSHKKDSPILNQNKSFFQRISHYIRLVIAIKTSTTLPFRMQSQLLSWSFFRYKTQINIYSTCIAANIFRALLSFRSRFLCERKKTDPTQSYLRYEWAECWLCEQNGPVVFIRGARRILLLFARQSFRAGSLGSEPEGAGE